MLVTCPIHHIALFDFEDLSPQQIHSRLCNCVTKEKELFTMKEMGLKFDKT